MGVRASVVLWAVCGGLLVAGCEDAEVDPPMDDSGVLPDAGRDAGDEDGGARRDAGTDAGSLFDAGPPPTGCELLDAGVPDASTPDASTPDGGPSDAGDATLPDAGDAAGPDAGPPSFDPPAPGAYPRPLAGPGGPSESYDEADLLEACAPLDGGERDRDHHNTAFMFDGRLWLPWAHEGGVGGISVFDFATPCAPSPVGTTVFEDMRETHSTGVARVGERDWMVTTSMTGILFWDVSDPSDPQPVTDMTLPGVRYPDSYARVVMSVFWQAPYVYVGASDNGVFIVDASDPERPELVAQYEPEPDFRVGGVHAIGTLLAIFPSEGSRTAFVDISDPGAPRPIPGGTFLLNDGTTDRLGPTLRAAYFAHINGGRAYYARHVIGGGLIVFDIADPSAPSFLGSWESPDRFANGGYVFVMEDEAFVGLSAFGEIIDIADPSAPDRVARLDMVGDVDTLTPVGNVIVASVDDDAVSGEASLVYPWKRAPDTRAPVVNMVVPRDGAEPVALGARVGLTVDEPVELATVHRGSFYVRPIDEAGEPLGPPLEGQYSGQEGVLNFWPAAPLAPATTYEVVVPAGGLTDVSGNATAAPFRSTFRTAACE